MADSVRLFIGASAFAAIEFVAALAVCAQPAASAPAAPLPPSAALFAEGCRLLAAGQCADAVTTLSNAVAARPDDCPYALKLAEAYACSGRPDAAKGLLSNLHADHPDRTDVALALAQALAHDAEFPRAVAVLIPHEARLDEAGLLVLVAALERGGQPARAALVARDGLRRLPRSEPLWLARIDQCLNQGRAALALRAIDDARQAIADGGQLSLRAARAYLMLGQALGAAEVRTVPGGRVGHVRDGWLLIDARRARDSFLCCPRASALFEIRRAVDAGLDTPELHCLHARAWAQAGMPERGLQLLKDRAAMLLERPEPATVRAYLDLALAAGDLEQAPRYALAAAALAPQHRNDILHDAYVRIAEAYNQRGNEPLYVEYLNRALELQPGDVRLSLRLADAEWQAERRGAAVRIYERLLRDHPELGGDQLILQRLADAQAPPAAPGRP